MTRVRLHPSQLILVLTFWTSVPVLQAQTAGPTPMPRIGFAPYASFLGRPTTGLASANSTTRRYDPGNWKKGALIGGVTGGILGGAFAVGVLCQLTDESCVGQTIGTMFISGAIGAFIGAVLIPATPVPR